MDIHLCLCLRLFMLKHFYILFNSFMLCFLQFSWQRGMQTHRKTELDACCVGH